MFVVIPVTGGRQIAVANVSPARGVLLRMAARRCLLSILL